MRFIITNADTNFIDHDRGGRQVTALNLKKDWQPMADRRALNATLYYVGVPLFVGLFVGWGQSPVPELNTHLVTAFYFAGFILIGWLCSVTAMTVGKKVLSPWRPPLWVLSVLPPMVLGWLALIPMNLYLYLTADVFPAGPELLKPLPIEPTFVFLKDYVLSMVSVLCLFTGTNYLFQFLGWRDFRYEGDELMTPHAPSGKIPASTPHIPFIPLLPKDVQGTPLCIRAQEHYIHVRTAGGAALIKYPFGHAVKSLESEPGIQVHRSYWVHDKAVNGIVKIGQRYFVVADTGEEIPISQSFSRAVRERYGDHFQGVG